MSGREMTAMRTPHPPGSRPRQDLDRNPGAAAEHAPIPTQVIYGQL
jgi:hypothetical protein